MYVCMYVYMYVFIYVCMYVCMYVYMYVFTHQLNCSHLNFVLLIIKWTANEILTLNDKNIIIQHIIKLVCLTKNNIFMNFSTLKEKMRKRREAMEVTVKYHIRSCVEWSTIDYS